MSIVIIIIIISVPYSVFVISLWKKWRENISISRSITTPKIKTVSVLLAVRNEEENILQLLGDLNNQNYPMQLMEVIVVDDDSEDDTYRCVEKFRDQAKFKLILMSSRRPEGVSPKKHAITLGLQEAAGEIILMTDGDCRIGAKWVEGMSAEMQCKSAVFIAGLVAVEGPTFFGKVVKTEFSSLVGSGMGLLEMGVPSMCNGANLAFSKQAFMESDVYGDNVQIASGDDVFMMQRLAQRFPGQVHNCYSRSTIVSTSFELSLRALLSQRIRWAGKWNKYSCLICKLLPPVLFLYHLLFAALLPILLLMEQWMALAALFLLKAIPERIFLGSVVKYIYTKFYSIPFWLLTFVYSYYVVVIGVLSNFKTYSWKGRRFK